MLSEAVATDLARDVDLRATAGTASLFGPRSAVEVRLLERAAVSHPDLCFEHCTHEQLRSLVRCEGIDFARSE